MAKGWQIRFGDLVDGNGWTRYAGAGSWTQVTYKRQRFAVDLSEDSDTAIGKSVNGKVTWTKCRLYHGVKLGTDQDWLIWMKGSKVLDASEWTTD